MEWHVLFLYAMVYYEQRPFCEGEVYVPIIIGVHIITNIIITLFRAREEQVLLCTDKVTV